MKSGLPQFRRLSSVPQSGGRQASFPEMELSQPASTDLGKITSDHIRTAVTSFWNAWTTKSTEELSDAYATNSTTFRAGSVSPEPGFMSIAQRSREYFHEACMIHVEIGPVETVVLNETTGVAVYTFRFRALNRAVAEANGTLQEEHVAYGRATQVFRRDPDGKLRILHEHVSSAV